jgi:hypothetical protein
VYFDVTLIFPVVQSRTKQRALYVATVYSVHTDLIYDANAIASCAFATTAPSLSSFVGRRPTTNRCLSYCICCGAKLVQLAIHAAKDNSSENKYRRRVYNFLRDNEKISGMLYEQQQHQQQQQDNRQNVD